MDTLGRGSKPARNAFTATSTPGVTGGVPNTAIAPAAGYAPAPTSPVAMRCTVVDTAVTRRRARCPFIRTRAAGTSHRSLRHRYSPTGPVMPSYAPQFTGAPPLRPRAEVVGIRRRLLAQLPPPRRHRTLHPHIIHRQRRRRRRSVRRSALSRDPEFAAVISNGADTGGCAPGPTEAVSESRPRTAGGGAARGWTQACRANPRSAARRQSGAGVDIKRVG